MFQHISTEQDETRAGEKNAEFTFGVHGQSLLTWVSDNQATILTQEETESVIYELGRSVMGSVRSLNEQFGLLRQAIMYSFVWRKHPELGIQFFVYRRTKTNNEGQLAQRLSLGAGGHFEIADIQEYFGGDGWKSTSVIDFPLTCATNYYRERGEELNGDDLGRFTYQEPTTLHGFVMDSKPTPGYVGNIHFGMLAGCRVLDVNIELEMKEPQNDAVGWFTAEELLGDLARGGKVLGTQHGDGLVDYEPWSKLMIEKIKELEATLKVTA